MRAEEAETAGAVALDSACWVAACLRIAVGEFDVEAFFGQVLLDLLHHLLCCDMAALRADSGRRRDGRARHLGKLSPTDRHVEDHITHTIFRRRRVLVQRDAITW